MRSRLGRYLADGIDRVLLLILVPRLAALFVSCQAMICDLNLVINLIMCQVYYYFIIVLLQYLFHICMNSCAQ